MIIAGNWKLNKSPKETIEFLKTLDSETSNLEQSKFIVFPPQVCLHSCSEVLSSSKIGWGAQNICHQELGAFTGETSVHHIKELGAQYTLVGHSERRHIFKEENSELNAKVKLAINEGVTSVLCVGETLEQREAGEVLATLKSQTIEALSGIKEQECQSVILAYEPVWAIGTGKVAEVAQVKEAHQVLRDIIKEAYSDTLSQNIKILYGGSVKPKNCIELSQVPGVDGFLIGGASLRVDSFVEIFKLVN